jgi:hypothetical protein
VARQGDFLSFSAFEREFSRTTDVAITARSVVFIYPESGLKVVMELKKRLSFGNGLNCTN